MSNYKNINKDDDKDIVGFSALYNAGFRVILRCDTKRITNISYQTLALSKYYFLIGVAKQKGRSDDGYSQYGWKKEEGGIYFKFSNQALRSYAKVLEDFSLNGENSIYLRPVMINGTKNPLEKPGFSRVIGTKIKKTYSIVLNTTNYKSKEPERTIGLMFSEPANNSKVSITLNLPEAYALSQELFNLCEFGSNLDLQKQLQFTSNSKSSNLKSNNVSLNDMNDTFDSEPESTSNNTSDDIDDFLK